MRAIKNTRQGLLPWILSVWSPPTMLSPIFQERCCLRLHTWSLWREDGRWFIVQIGGWTLVPTINLTCFNEVEMMIANMYHPRQIWSSFHLTNCSLTCWCYSVTNIVLVFTRNNPCLNLQVYISKERLFPLFCFGWCVNDNAIKTFL